MVASIKRQNLRYLASIHTQVALAKRVGAGLTQPQISQILGGKKGLTRTQARLIEDEFGIPAGWLEERPIQRIYSLLRELQGLCRGDAQKLKLVHRLLNIALENASSSRAES